MGWWTRIRLEPTLPKTGRQRVCPQKGPTVFRDFDSKGQTSTVSALLESAAFKAASKGRYS